MRTPRVLVLAGIEAYVGGDETTVVLAAYSNKRAAESAQADVEMYGWNKTKNKPADWDTEDTTDDDVIQFDTTSLYELPLRGAEKVVPRGTRRAKR